MKKSEMFTYWAAGLLMFAVVFVGPVILQHAWKLIAVDMFGLPRLSYWAAFWGGLVLNELFGRRGDFNRDRKNTVMPFSENSWKGRDPGINGSTDSKKVFPEMDPGVPKHSDEHTAE